MKKELIQKLHKSFEDCAHEKDGVEYWLARELQDLLGYTQWRNFEAVIDKAKVACAKAGQAVEDHFADVSKMIDLAKGAQREVDDLALSRYACYLIAQNGDVRKLLTDRDIVPENLPAAEDAKKLERRLKSEEKKLPRQTPRLSGKHGGARK